eukprot:gene4848-biopygen4057
MTASLLSTSCRAAAPPCGVSPPFLCPFPQCEECFQLRGCTGQ